MKRLLAVALLVAAPAHAQFRTGNEWLSMYRSTVTVERTYALGYIAGVIDGHPNICTAQGVTLQQAADMVAHAITVAPSMRHHPASLFATVVLEKEWPCKQTREQRL